MEDEELERIKAEKMKEMMSQQNPGVVELNSSSFDNFLKTDLPVVVDLWADWCMPCRIMAPVMEELAKDYAGKALFGKVNVDQDSEIANRYKIMSIPHFLIFKNGTLVEKIVGAVGRGPLENALKKHL
ncbi:MAG: thioredoxin [Candidatus Bathyarchaeota archaeon]|jgi:thioredoxin 1|nr:thioredoxin [Candidatus Bathyarchaeota archaeon]